MSNYVRNRNRTSSRRFDEYDEANRRSELIGEIRGNITQAREIIQSTELFPGLVENEGAITFTREEVDLLRRESKRARDNQKNTNYGLVFGSSLGVYSGGVAMAGLMASVGTVVAATGGVAAIVGGVSSVAAAISRSRSESYTKTQVQSIVEKLNRLPDIISAMLTVSDLAPGEFGIENVLENRQTSLTVENLIEIKRKTMQLVKVLSDMQKADTNKDLNSMLEVLRKASSLINNINTQLDPNTEATVATVVATTGWLLSHYRGASQNYRNALQLIEKFIIASPTVINLLAKSGMLSANWSNIVKIVSSSEGIKAVEKFTEELLEKAGTKVASKAGAEVVEKGTEKVVEQVSTNVTSSAGSKVSGKIGGEALEQVGSKVGGEILEQTSSKVAGKASGKALKQVSSKVAGKASGKAVKQVSSKVAGTASKEVIQQSGNTVARKVGEEAVEQVGVKVAGKVSGEVVEKASTKVAGEIGGKAVEQVGSKVAGTVGEEVIQQSGNTVARKVGEEVVEQTANSSSNVSGIVSSAAKVRYIRILCASVVIAGIVVDGVTLKTSLENLYNGSPTELSNFLSSLADTLETLVL